MTVTSTHSTTSAPHAEARGRPGIPRSSRGRRRGPARTLDTVADYDAPRTSEDDAQMQPLGEFASRAAPTHSGGIDDEDLLEDDPSDAEDLDLPDTDWPEEELTGVVVPQRREEFLCTRCYLLHHHAQLAQDTAGGPCCRDCAT